MQHEFCPTPPSTNNSIPVINALDEGNYSMAREQIDDIQTGDNWFNIRNELESRQAIYLVSCFNYSMLELEGLTKGEDSLSFPAKQVKMLSENLDDIVNKLDEPAVNVQRLVLTTSVVGIVIGSGQFIIPRVRKRFNIKY